MTSTLVTASQQAVTRVTNVGSMSSPEAGAPSIAGSGWLADGTSLRMTGASTAILDLSALAVPSATTTTLTTALANSGLAPGFAAAPPAGPNAGPNAGPIAGTVSAALSMRESRAAGDAPPSTLRPAADAVLTTVPAYRYLSTDLASTYLRVLPVAEMSGQELRDTLAARRAYKQALFAEAVQQLARQPALADLPPCSPGAAGAEGQCAWQPARPALGQTEGAAAPLAASADGSVPQATAASAPATASTFADTPADTSTTPTAQPAAAPTPAPLPTTTADSDPPPRRLAVVIGINRYDDRRIPQLVGAVPDADLVTRTLREALGYDVQRVTDARKPEVFAALNQLARDARPQDSLLVYYAGHGEMVETTDLGYWIPRDGRADDPRGWVSNRDLNKILSASASRQITVVSDSCFSGRFAQQGRIDATGDDAGDPQRLRQQRAVTVMTSGGDEPVADTGRNGHSVFAWNLVQRLRGLGRWASGAGLFAKVRTAVQSELPQTPQYGAATDAGHQRGADFVFEPRTAPREDEHAQRGS